MERRENSEFIRGLCIHSKGFFKYFILSLWYECEDYDIHRVSALCNIIDFSCWQRFTRPWPRSLILWTDRHSWLLGAQKEGASETVGQTSHWALCVCLLPPKYAVICLKSAFRASVTLRLCIFPFLTDGVCCFFSIVKCTFLACAGRIEQCMVFLHWSYIEKPKQTLQNNYICLHKDRNKHLVFR